MAGQYLYSANLTKIAAGTASATQYGVWCLDPVTNPVTVVEFGFGLDGSSAAQSFQVSLVTQSAGNTGTISSLAWPDQRAPSATTTVTGNGTSAVGTTTGTLCSWAVQPFGGQIDIQYPLMREPGAAAAATTARIGLAYTNPGSTVVNLTSYVVWSEG